MTPPELGAGGRGRGRGAGPGGEPSSSMNRTIDLLVSALGLIALSPLLTITALLIKLTSPGPILYRAERVGKDGKLFRLYKFRSMAADADKAGPKITAQGDRRVTPLGRWLRKLKLDELPQLINVLKGEMSMVGPRPEDPHYVAYYTPEQRQVLSVLPGITSAASVRYRHEERILDEADWESKYLNEVMPEKLAIELEYIERRTFLSDLKIIVATFLSLFR